MVTRNLENPQPAGITLCQSTCTFKCFKLLQSTYGEKRKKENEEENERESKKKREVNKETVNIQNRGTLTKSVNVFER